MNTMTASSNRTHSLVSLLLVVSLLLGSLALAGCTGSKDEQDNCYGEDVPDVNE